MDSADPLQPLPLPGGKLNTTDEKIALVTGGIGNIGTEVCKELCRQGRRVVAGYLPDEETTAHQWLELMLDDEFQVELAAGDVACYDSSADMVTDIEKNFGPVEILVNCAGISRDRVLQRMEKDHWNAVISTNLNSVFNVTRHVVDGMIERGFGRVINISSVNGQRGQFGQTNYSAAKAGIHGFTMSLAQELANKGITVNTVSPGYVETEMTRAVPDEIREQIVLGIPVGRMGNPKEIAQTVAFLSSDETSYITGANIPVNGGLYMSY